MDGVSNQITKAHRAFDVWSRFPLKRRIGYLDSLKSLIYKERKEIAKLLVQDSARVQFSAEGLVFEVLNIFSIAKVAKRIIKSRKAINLGKLFHRDKKCYVVYEPIGIIAIISPANSPFFESFQQIIQAVVMGNVVVVKPSEQSPLVSKKIEDLIRASDMPDGVINIIHGGPEIGEEIVRSQLIDKVVLFGRHSTGLRVATLSSGTVKPFVLGLGGNEAAIVLEDCYLSRTVEGLVYGAFCNSGQTCSCIRRVIALRGVADELLDKLKTRTERLNIGVLGDVNNEIGMVKRKEDAKLLLSAVDEAKREGAKVVTGGIYESDINRISPIIITNLNPQMKIMQEEFMGPYMCFSVVDNMEDAIALANNTKYGLSASIWTSNFKKAERIARQLNVGTVWINDSQFYHYLLPYGGIKQSGFGKTSGREGLLEYVNKKLICVDKTSKSSFYWFPYSRKKLSIMRSMLSLKHSPNKLDRIKYFLNLFFSNNK